MKWNDNFKTFNYLSEIYIEYGLIRERIYSDSIYTPGVWDDALKVSLENVYQKHWKLEVRRFPENLNGNKQLKNLFLRRMFENVCVIL